ncbi:MAG: class I SAM-dependent methyltransferase [Candidatus Aenigmatarchaeota archaeon]
MHNEYYRYEYFRNNKYLNRLIQDKNFYLAKSEVFYKIYFKNLKLKNKKILDFGCGLGQVTYMLCDTAEVHGYDISKIARDFCRKNTKIKILKKRDIKNNFYDVIVVSHVLEHTPKPLETLTMLRKKLKKNGIFLLILPVEDNKHQSHVNDHHLYCWNFRTITNLLYFCGFEIISIRLDYDYGSTKFLWLSRLSLNLYHVFIKLLSKLMCKPGEMIIIAKPSI